MHHCNSTQYCKTETVFSMFPFLQTNITSQMWPSGGNGNRILHTILHRLTCVSGLSVNWLDVSTEQWSLKRQQSETTNIENQQTLLVRQASTAAWMCFSISSQSRKTEVTRATRRVHSRTLCRNRCTKHPLTLNASSTCPVFDSNVSYGTNQFMGTSTQIYIYTFFKIQFWYLRCCGCPWNRGR